MSIIKKRCVPIVKFVHLSVVSGFHLIGQGLPVSKISPDIGAVGKITALAQPASREIKAVCLMAEIIVA